MQTDRFWVSLLAYGGLVVYLLYEIARSQGVL